MSGLKWLITGGCGFIGLNLVQNLLTEKVYSIRILDNLKVGQRADLARLTDFHEETDLVGKSTKLPQESMLGNDKVELVVGDIMDSDLCLAASRNCDVIVHLAANTGVAPSVEDPKADMMNNVLGTFNLLEAARLNGVKRFVFASSGAPVGETVPPIHEELAPHPVSPYGASKLAGEGYCSAYFRTYQVPTVALRFGNVYGPLSLHKSSVVAKFISRALAGEQLEIFGDGNQTRDFIFIDDLIHAIRQAVRENNAVGEVFQIATMQETSVNEIVDALQNTLEKICHTRPVVHNSAHRKGDVMRNYSDTTKARELLKWEAKTQLMEGLYITAKWFVDQNTNQSSHNI